MWLRMPSGEAALESKLSSSLSVCTTWLQAAQRFQYGWLFARQGRSAGADGRHLSSGDSAGGKREGEREQIDDLIEREGQGGKRRGGERHEKDS